MSRAGGWAVAGYLLSGVLGCADAFAATKAEVLLGGRGLAEVWQDPSLAKVYRSSLFSGAGVGGLWFDLGLPVDLGVEADITYHRLDGAAVSLSTGRSSSSRTTVVEMVPVGLRVGARVPVGRASVYGTLGPAVTTWQEMAPAASLAGTKWGLALEGGVRFDTGFVDPPMDHPGRALQGVDAEVFIGRRQHQLFGYGEGLDFSAWRVGAGLSARF